MDNPEKLATLATEDTRRKQKNQQQKTTQYVLDTTIHNTQDEDKQNKKHNVLDT
jgi:hypothetical protein